MRLLGFRGPLEILRPGTGFSTIVQIIFWPAGPQGQSAGGFLEHMSKHRSLIREFPRVPEATKPHMFLHATFLHVGGNPGRRDRKL